MRRKPPVIVIDLFSRLNEELLGLLRGLSLEQWRRPSPCPGWSVKDVASHLLADNLGYLSRRRDGFAQARFDGGDSWTALVDFINHQNEQWVEVTRRLSPKVLCEMLEFTGPQVIEYFRTVDPFAMGGPVSWAGPEPAPNWLQLAREYTEFWMHQQQIREGVQAPPLDSRELLGPVLDTFVHALPRTYATTEAQDGTHVRLVVEGEAGGAWSLVRAEGRWGLFIEVESEPAAEVTLDQDTAWRLYTKGLSRDVARARATLSGDQALGEVLFDVVAIIA